MHGAQMETMGNIADSRSVDILVHDKPAMLPLFSVGDRGAQGASHHATEHGQKRVNVPLARVQPRYRGFFFQQRSEP